VTLATVLLAGLVVPGCTTLAGLAPLPYTAVPPSCPYEDVIQYNGDSIGLQWAAYGRVPGYARFDAAQGGSGFVFSAFPTIGSRVRQWIEQCGVPDAVVISGGGNDIGHGEYVASIKQAIAELGPWLAERGVPTVWVTVEPWPADSIYQRFDPQRRELNDWLLAGGAGWGTVADIGPALGGATLNPDFWVWATANRVDSHPNAAGLTAAAAVVDAAITSVLPNN